MLIRFFNDHNLSLASKIFIMTFYTYVLENLNVTFDIYKRDSKMFIEYNI